MSSTLLSHRHIFGLKSDANNHIHFIDEDLVLYPSGHNTVIFNIESKTQKFIQATEGTKGITALSVSANRRYVAVAERSSRGVVNIYDLHTLKKRKVLTTTDSTSTDFVSMCFSNDHKYILTQGGGPDWTLVLWQWEKAKALSSIKVSNANGAPITQCSFNPNDPSIVSVSGNGIFKAFRITDGTFKPMPNLLNPDIEHCNFTSHLWMHGDRVLLGNDQGQLILYEAGEYLGVLSGSPNDNETVTCLITWSKGFVMGGQNGTVRIFEEIADNQQELGYYREVRVLEFGQQLRSGEKLRCLAIPKSEDNLIATTNMNQIHVSNLIDSTVLQQNKPESGLGYLISEFHGMSAAGFTTVTGMDVCVRKPLVVTCGVDSSVRIWNYIKRAPELHKTFPDEAYSVAFHPSGLHLLVGFADKLRAMNVLMDDIRTFKEIPVKNCRECRFSNGGHLFAAVNGNTIQVFNFFTCECIGTLRGHNGKVRSLHWTQDDTQLISSGMDGAVYQWDLKEFKREGEYVKKGCNYSCAIANQDGDAIFAVGSDRMLREIEFPASSVTKEIESNAILGQLVLSNSQRMLFAGTANPEQPGCVRSYKFPLTGDYTEYQCLAGPITRMRVSSDDTYVFVTGEDGAFCILDVREKDGRPVLKREKDVLSRFAEEILVTKSDLEEKNSLMVELKNKVDELTLHNEYQLRLKDMNYNEKIKEVTEKFTQDLEHDKNKYEMLREEKNDLEMEYDEKIKMMDEKHQRELQDIETSFQAKIMAEVERYQLLMQEKDMQQTQWRDQQRMLVESHEQYVAEVTEDYEQKLEEDRELKGQMCEERDDLVREFNEIKRQLELDIDQEIEELKEKYESKLNAEREATLRFKGENGIMKKKFSALQKDIEVQREDIKGMLEKEQELIAQIGVLEREIQHLKSQIRDRDETIGDKEKRIYELKKKNQELEKFKFVLDYKIKELKRQIEPRENEISEMKEQIKEMDKELEQYHKSNAILDDLIGELRTKLDGMQKVIMNQRQRLSDQSMRMNRFMSELEECVQHVQSPDRMTDVFEKMYHLHVPEKVTTEQLDHDIEHEYHRQREYLEKSVDALKKRLNHDVKIHKEDNMRIMQENMALIKEIHELREEMTQIRVQGSHEIDLNSEESKIMMRPSKPRKVGKYGGRKIKQENQLAMSLDGGLSQFSSIEGQLPSEEEMRIIEEQRREIGRLKERLAHLEQERTTKRSVSREKLAPLHAN